MLMILGTFFDNTFWSLGWYAWIGDSVGIPLLVVSLLVLLTPFLFKKEIRLDLGDGGLQKFLFVAIPAIAMTCGFHFFPITLDQLGDAAFIRETETAKVLAWDSSILWHLFVPEITDPKVGTETFYAINNLVAYVFDIPWNNAVRGTELLFGFLFIGAWQLIILDSIQNWTKRILLTLIGISAPSLFVFASHFELYAVPMLSNLLACFAIYKLLTSNDKRWVFGVLLGMYIAVNSHISGLLIFPGAVLAILYNRYREHEFVKKHFQSKKVLYLIYVPCLLIGLFVYLFITKSANGPRSYSSEDLYSAVFLPLSSSEPAPLDRYNLLSFFHFFDYASSWTFWSPAAFILFLFGASRISKADWNRDPAMVVITLTMANYLAFFFVLNPLFSIPIDIDLLSLTFPIFLLLIVRILAIEKSGSTMNFAIANTVALSVLGFSAIFVNADESRTSDRYEAIGNHVFKSYYLGISSLVTTAISVEETHEDKIARLDKILTDLRPYAIAENDHEYAELLSLAGSYYSDSLGNHEKALSYFNRAQFHSPFLIKNVYRLLVSNFIIGKPAEAHRYSKMLIDFAYPNKKRALRIAIHVSLEASDFEFAEYYTDEYLGMYPDDANMQRVAAGLDTMPDKRQVLQYFRRQ